jgi:branched-chain amino acid transport system substrate-binding protein
MKIRQTKNLKEEAKVKRKGLTILVSICLVLIVVALPFIGACAKPAPQTLKIGALMSLTGFASASETLVWDGVQLFQDWINEKGGITIKGQPYTIQFVVEDGQSSADGAVAAANKLVYDHGVKFIVGTVMPFMVIAAGTVTEPAKVIRVAYYNCGTPDEYGPNTPYTFICNDTTLDYMTPNMQYMKEAYPNLKKITVLTPDDGAPPFFEPVFRKKAADEGLVVSGWELWSLDTTDFVPVTVKALATNPDAIFLINGWPIHMGSMLKAAREAGFTGPVFACHEDPYDIREVAGRAASTEFYVHNLTLESPEMTSMIKEINKRAQAKYGRLSPTYVWGFNAPYCLTQAIEEAQSLDPTVVKDSWEKMKSIKTAYGDGRIGGMTTFGINHTVSYPMPLTTLKNGEVVWVMWQKVPLP